MRAQSRPTAQRRQLAVWLRELRENADLKIEDVAEALNFSPSKLSRIETGQVSVVPDDVQDLLNVYDVRDERRERLIQIAREARQKSWWQKYSDVRPSAYVGYESTASTVYIYEALLVHGLLQTSDYARAVLHSLRPEMYDEEVERWIKLRTERQALLTQDDPPAVDAILNEAVLRSLVGGPAVMRDQLNRLIEIARLPAVTLRVLLFEAGEHPGLHGAFTILGFPEPTQPDLVYLEHNTRESFLKSRDELRRYREVFKRLGTAALEPDESVAFIVKLAKSL